MQNSLGNIFKTHKLFGEQHPQALVAFNAFNLFTYWKHA